MGAHVDSIEDPLLRAMVRDAANYLTTYLQANGIDPAPFNPVGAAYFMVNALQGPARAAAWHGILALHAAGDPAGEHFDHDPAALAWAAAKVQRHIAKLRDWQAKSAEQGKTEQSEQWRRMANHLERTFIGGEGCVIAAFDARLPQVHEQRVVTS